MMALKLGVDAGKWYRPWYISQKVDPGSGNAPYAGIVEVVRAQRNVCESYVGHALSKKNKRSCSGAERTKVDSSLEERSFK